MEFNKFDYIVAQIKYMKKHTDKKASYNMFKYQNIREMLDCETLAKIVKIGWSINWEDVTRQKYLSEDFIKEHHFHLAPTIILENYPGLSPETKGLFIPRIGLITKIKYDLITEDEAILQYSRLKRDQSQARKIRSLILEEKKNYKAFTVYIMLN